MIIKNKKKKIFFSYVLIIIIISIIFSNFNYYLINNNNNNLSLLKINNKNIDINTIYNIYKIETIKHLKILKNNFNDIQNSPKYIKRTYQYILSKLIHENLLEQYIYKLKININEKIIKNNIFYNSYFKTKNIFNKNKYIHFLNQYNLSSQEYINILKNKIIIKKLINNIVNTEFILKNEKIFFFNKINKKNNISFKKINIQPWINKQTISKKEINFFYQKNQKKFTKNEIFNINIIQFKKYNDKFNYSKQDIQEWYNKNISKYNIPEKKRYIIFQIHNKYDGLKILHNIKNKKIKLFNIIKKKSYDINSKIYFKDLNWIESKYIINMIKNVKINKNNKISNLIKYKSHFFIIKLYGIKKKKYKKISNIYNNIQKEIINQKNHNIIYNIIKKKNTLVNIVKNKNLYKINNKYYLNRTYIPKEINKKIIKNIIFNNKKNFFQKNILISYNNQKNIILTITNYQPQKLLPLHKIKNKIIYFIKIKKAKQKIQKISQNIIYKIQNNKNNNLKKNKLFFHFIKNNQKNHHNKTQSCILNSLNHKIYKNKYNTIYNQYGDILIISLNQFKNKNFFNQNQQNILFQKIKKINEKNIIKYILNNLKKNSKIKNII